MIVDPSFVTNTSTPTKEKGMGEHTPWVTEMTLMINVLAYAKPLKIIAFLTNSHCLS